MTDFNVEFKTTDTFNVEFEGNNLTVDFSVDNFTVDFEQPTPFTVEFTQQGAQGPSGDDGEVRLWTSTYTFREGQLARDSDYVVYVSETNNNLNNVLTDTDHWVPIEASASLSFRDERSSDTFSSTRLVIDSDTGFEVVEVGSSAILRKYVAPTPFSFSITGGQGNLSWFNSSTTDTANINVTSGAIRRFNSATVTDGTASINSDNSVVTYDVGVDPKVYTLSVSMDGDNSDSSEQSTHIATHSWTVYRDWWLQTNQTSSEEAFDDSVGREGSNYSNRALSCEGHTYFAVSVDAFPSEFTFSTTLGQLHPAAPTTITVTINGVTKQYRRYYLGDFHVPTNVTTHGGS